MAMPVLLLYLGEFNLSSFASLGQELIPKGDVPSSTPILHQLPEPLKNERAKLLLELHSEPVSSPLRAYFETLKDGSREWSINTFIEGANYLSNILGPEKEKYYPNTLKGLHFPNSFTRLWNERHPQQPISALDAEKYQCPPGWSNKLNKDFCQVLAYEEEGPLGPALNAVLAGPTQIDCGMWSQLAAVFMMRYVIGDELFHKTFRFKKGEFVITQQCYQPTDSRCKSGNLFYPFYDNPLLYNTLGTQPRIEIMSVFNHPNYLKKHPGGMGRLQNVVKIDGYNLVFKPGAHQNIFSDMELEQDLLKAYNAPRDPCDEKTLRLWNTFPDFKHPHFGGKSFGDLAKEAKEFENHTLSETEWNGTRAYREKMAHKFRLIFNFNRLIKCVEETRKLCLDGGKEGNILFRARELQKKDFFERLFALGNRSHGNRGPTNFSSLQHHCDLLLDVRRV